MRYQNQGLLFCFVLFAISNSSLARLMPSQNLISQPTVPDSILNLSGEEVLSVSVTNTGEAVFSIMETEEYSQLKPKQKARLLPILSGTRGILAEIADNAKSKVDEVLSAVKMDPLQAITQVLSNPFETDERIAELMGQQEIQTEATEFDPELRKVRFSDGAVFMDGRSNAHYLADGYPLHVLQEIRFTQKETEMQNTFGLVLGREQHRDDGMEYAFVATIPLNEIDQMETGSDLHVVAIGREAIIKQTVDSFVANLGCVEHGENFDRILDRVDGTVKSRLVESIQSLEQRFEVLDLRVNKAPGQAWKKILGRDNCYGQGYMAQAEMETQAEPQSKRVAVAVMDRVE